MEPNDHMTLEERYKVLITTHKRDRECIRNMLRLLEYYTENGRCPSPDTTQEVLTRAQRLLEE